MFIAVINLLSPGEICMVAYFHGFATIFFKTKQQQQQPTPAHSPPPQQKQKANKQKKTHTQKNTTGSALIETATSRHPFTTRSKT